MFSGVSGDGCTIFDDTWTWDGRFWAQLHPPTSPPGRSFGSLAFDESTKTTILFGGGAPNSDPGRLDTWSWDGSTWTKLQPPTAPNLRVAATLAYDDAIQSLLFVGPSSPQLQDVQIWRWNRTTWVRPSAAAGPSLRSEAAIAFDQAHGLLVFFGGYTCEAGPDCFPNDTWVWDGSQWRQLYPKTSPPGVGLAAYDPVHKAVVLFAEGQTWIWDGNNWSQQHPAVSPRRRYFASMTYDPALGKVVLFGGKTSYLVAGSLYEQVNNELWSWDGSNWKQEA